MVETLRIVAMFLGVVAFFWRVWDLFRSYLHIELSVTVKGQWLIARTTVENKSLRPKCIEYAVLIVGPESESPIDTFNNVAEAANEDVRAQHTNEIAYLHFSKPMFGSKGRAVIPLPFYYSENVNVADERLTYSAPIHLREIESGVPYSVRFFIAGKCRLHRSTHDCFTLSKIERVP